MEKGTLLSKDGKDFWINIYHGKYDWVNLDNEKKAWQIKYHGQYGDKKDLVFKNKKEALESYDKLIKEYMNEGWKNVTPGFESGWQKDEE